MFILFLILEVLIFQDKCYIKSEISIIQVIIFG